MLPQNVVYAIHVLLYLYSPSVNRRNGCLRHELEGLRGMNGVVAVRVAAAVAGRWIYCKKQHVTLPHLPQGDSSYGMRYYGVVRVCPLYSSRDMNFCPMLGGNSVVDEFFGILNDNIRNQCMTVSIFDLQMRQIMLSESKASRRRLVGNGTETTLKTD